MPTSAQEKALADYNRAKWIAIPLIGKRPICKNWTKTPHTPYDLKVFNGHNIGILTGKPSRLTILDIDSQDNGIAHWNRIKKLFPPIETPMVSTPGKGVHLYFKFNPKLSSTIKLHLNKTIIGWDVLNIGRQVAAPPSHGYRWIKSINDTPLIHMPQWLEQYILLLKAPQ